MEKGHGLGGVSSWPHWVRRGGSSFGYGVPWDSGAGVDSISGICDTPCQNGCVTVEEAVVGMDRWSREKKDTLVDLILSCLDARNAQGA